MAYLQIERTGGADGLDAIGKFASLQQGLQQGLLQQQLMQSRLQTETLERQAQQFGLDEAKAAAPVTRVLRQLEAQSAEAKANLAKAQLGRLPAEWNQQDRMVDQRLAQGQQDLDTGSIKQRAMNFALKEQQDAYQTGKLAGPAYLKMLKDAGVTGLPQAAADLFQGQIGERVAQQMLGMTQFKQQMDLKNQALQVEMQKIMNPWKDPNETIQFIKGIGVVARDNPELLKQYKERLGDPDLNLIIDGALRGAADNPDPDKAFDLQLQAAIASDDPAVRDSALNYKAVRDSRGVKGRPVLDAAGNPRMFEDEMGNTKPMETPAYVGLKQDLVNIYKATRPGATSRPTTRPTTGPAGRGPREQIVDSMAPFMSKLDSLNLNPKQAQRVTDSLGMLRTGDKTGLPKLLALLPELSPDQVAAIREEIAAIDSGR